LSEVWLLNFLRSLNITWIILYYISIPLPKKSAIFFGATDASSLITVKVLAWFGPCFSVISLRSKNHRNGNPRYQTWETSVEKWWSKWIFHHTIGIFIVEESRSESRSCFMT
jgi:hypothetical protein